MSASNQTDVQSIDMQLATHVATAQYADLPAHTVQRIATFVADTLSVGMAGSSVPQARLLLNTLAATESRGTRETKETRETTGTVPIWGTGQTQTAPNAILANAFNVHCQEFDCVHEGAVVHAMATLLPVLMAEVQMRHERDQPVSGPELIAAVAVGIDVASTLGLAAKHAMRFFRPATAGGFGAAAGLARLRGFDAAQVLAAWGFQLAQTSGTMQGHREGRPVLPLQVSFNARAAWQSCELAQSGIASLAAPISGECGYLAMFEGEYDIEPLMQPLGKVWRIDEFSHKPYPSGRATHAGIEGLLELIQKHQLKPEHIESVVVRGPSLISRLVNRPAQPEPSPNYARLCMPYVLAKVMQHGQLLPTHYGDKALADPQTFELGKRVHMQVDDNPDPNAFTPVTVTVQLTNGESHQTRLDHMLASPQRPLTRQQCQDKFDQCCALAINPPAQPPNQPSNLFERIMNLASMTDVSTLLHTTH